MQKQSWRAWPETTGKKCNLFQHEAAYLGHILSKKEVATDPAKRKLLHAPLHYLHVLPIVGVDYLSLRRPDDGYQYILITDLFSKFAAPTRDQSADTTVRALYNNLSQTFGCPEHA